jgi:type II secretory pathway component PulF
MNERPVRPAPPASAVRSQEKPQEGARGQRPVRTAQRPDTSGEWRARVARAWARHPVVSLVRHRQRLTFFEGLHGMLRAGLPLNMAFTELARGSEKDPFRRAIAQVGATVARGSGLAEALRRHPVWFESQAVDLVEAGEVSGTLEGALARVIEWMKEAQQLRWRTLSLCLYPAYLVVAFLLGGSLLDGSSSVSASGSLDSLPAATATSFVGNLLRIILIGGAIFSAPLALAALGLEERWERVRQHIPVLGRFHRETQAGRFSRVLGTSLGAGLEAARSLQMAIEATGNSTLRAKAASAVQRLRDGATLTDVVEWLGVLDGESLRRVATGEKTGHLEPMLQQLAREHAEAGLRWLRALVFALILVLTVLLFATIIARIFSSQADYYRRLDDLSRTR